MAINLSKYIKGVRIETAFLPEIYIADPFAANQPPNPLLQALKPKITIELGKGLSPAVMAPYGKPGPSMWPTIQIGLLIAGIGFMVWRAIK